MRQMAIAEGVDDRDDAAREKGAELLQPVQHLSEALAHENLKVSMKTDYTGGNNQLGFTAMHQTTNATRKTAYAANQHSVSIIGSDTGTIHQPKNFMAPGDMGTSV